MTGDPSNTYRAAIAANTAELGMWDYLHYDAAGDLWLGGLRVRDAVQRYGTPLEIVDTTLVERRCREWRAMAHAAADAASYPGRLDFLYAAKANMASEVAAAAYRSGWNAETSSVQDLHNLLWLKRNHLLPPGLRVVCNGFKLPPETYGFPQPAHSPGSHVQLPNPPHADDARRQPISYAEEIAAMAAHGWHITPILDAGELPFFQRPGTPNMEVGLRLKFGPVDSLAELATHVSRFGQEPAAVEAAARSIAASPHLTFTTLHAMVGAAETISVPRLLRSLGLAARLWAELRRQHPTLRELNMGGGLPPLGDAYDHRAFLDGLFPTLMAAAAEAGVPAPDFTFELGSLVASESGFHIFKVLQDKRNHTDETDGAGDWAIVDGGLMAAIPDMLIIDRRFHVLAVSGANRPPRRVRLGDLTCDSDGRYPPQATGHDAHVLLPAAEGEQHVLIPMVGAYQEILSGVRGAHHCGLLEAVELILEADGDGQVQGRLMPRQTFAEAATLLGYNEDALDGLAAALAASRGEA